MDASRLLESLGHEVVDVAVPLPHEAVPGLRDLLGGAHRALGRAARAGAPAAAADPLADRARPGGQRPEFGLAIGAMRRFAAGALTALAPYDAVLTPTLAVPPLPVGAIRDDADPAADFEAQKRFTPWTSAWNVTGMPAASLPLHWTDRTGCRSA